MNNFSNLNNEQLIAYKKRMVRAGNTAAATKAGIELKNRIEAEKAKIISAKKAKINAKKRNAYFANESKRVQKKFEESVCDAFRKYVTIGKYLDDFYMYVADDINEAPQEIHDAVISKVISLQGNAKNSPSLRLWAQKYLKNLVA